MARPRCANPRGREVSRPYDSRYRNQSATFMAVRGSRAESLLLAGREYDSVGALAIAEGLEMDGVAQMVGQQPEQRPVEPVHDRAIHLARAAERALVLAQVAHEQVLDLKHAARVQQRQGVHEALERGG